MVEGGKLFRERKKTYMLGYRYLQPIFYWVRLGYHVYGYSRIEVVYACLSLCVIRDVMVVIVAMLG